MVSYYRQKKSPERLTNGPCAGVSVNPNKEPHVETWGERLPLIKHINGKKLIEDVSATVYFL